MRHSRAVWDGEVVIDVHKDGGRQWRATASLLRLYQRHNYPPHDNVWGDSPLKEVFDYLYSLTWDEHEGGR